MTYPPFGVMVGEVIEKEAKKMQQFEKKEEVRAEIFHGDRAYDDYLRTKDPHHISLAKAYWSNAGHAYRDLHEMS